MEILTRVEDGRRIIEIHGEFDVQSAPVVRTRIMDLIAEGSDNIVLDLSQVNFLDSTGIGVIAATMKRVRRSGGSLELICVNPAIVKLLVLTGLSSVIRVSDTLDPASLN